MGQDSKIEWTDTTWNPVVGCSKVSAGCAHCYAVGQAARIERMQPKNQAYASLTMVRDNGVRDWTGEVRCLPERLDHPLRWQKPRRVFVNSMSDLFHPDVPFEFIAAVFGVMAATQRHTFQVLTKRPERMLEWFHWFPEHYNGPRLSGTDWDHLSEKLRQAPETLWPLPNVWIGVSVEDQRAADERIPLLVQVPACVRFLSCEPLLGPVNIPALGLVNRGGEWQPAEAWSEKRRMPAEKAIHWVIVGGESGPNARPMNPDWARAIRDQCNSARVPFFFKQHGEWEEVAEDAATRGDQYMICRERSGKTEARYQWDLYAWNYDDPPMKGAEAGRWSPWRDVLMHRAGKHSTGRLLDGRTWDEMPEVPQ